MLQQTKTTFLKTLYSIGNPNLKSNIKQLLKTRFSSKNLKERIEEEIYKVEVYTDNLDVFKSYLPTELLLEIEGVKNKVKKLALLILINYFFDNGLQDKLDEVWSKFKYISRLQLYSIA